MNMKAVRTSEVQGTTARPLAKNMG